MVGKISFITFGNGVNLESMLGTHFLRMNVKLMTVSQKFKSCMNFQVGMYYLAKLLSILLGNLCCDLVH